MSIQNFLFLGMCFITIMLGFGLLYMLLELKGIHILMENGEYISGDFFDYIYTTMYFSGVTFFSVGYGDVIPIGLGRIAALIESWLGFTIPAAFVVKSFINYEKN